MIAVESLTKRFGSTLAVHDLSFEARPGVVTGFLGPNGAGKTTTLRALVGLIAPTSGRVFIEGRTYAELRRPIATVGAVLDRAGFHPRRSGRNHLRMIAAMGGLAPTRIEETLRQVELVDAADRAVGGYSLGMKQRLGLAAALLGDPRVLILDEPANGLDPQGMRWLRELLRSLAAEGRVVLVSSHVLAEMSQTVDEVVVIGRGRLIAQTTLEELTAGRGGVIRARTPMAETLAAELRSRGITVRQPETGLLEVVGATTSTVGEAAAARRVVLHELVETGTSLEEVYLELTGEARPG